MPRVNLGRDREAELVDQKRRMLKKRMTDRDLNQEELAAEMGIHNSSLCVKMSKWRWSLEDMRKLNKVLKFDDADRKLLFQ